MIFGAGFREGHPWLAAVALALLLLGFAGLLRAAHRMLLGTAPAAAPPRGSWVGTVPIVAALAVLVLTGLAWPPGLADALALAANAVSRWRGVRSTAACAPSATRARPRWRCMPRP